MVRLDMTSYVVGSNCTLSKLVIHLEILAVEKLLDHSIRTSPIFIQFAVLPWEPNINKSTLSQWIRIWAINHISVHNLKNLFQVFLPVFSKLIIFQFQQSASLKE